MSADFFVHKGNGHEISTLSFFVAQSCLEIEGVRHSCCVTDLGCMRYLCFTHSVGFGEDAHITFAAHRQVKRGGNDVAIDPTTR